MLHQERDQLGDLRKIWSSESLMILHLPGQYISCFFLNFQCRMGLEHEGSVLPHFHIVLASLLDCSDCNWMKMQGSFLGECPGDSSLSSGFFFFPVFCFFDGLPVVSSCTNVGSSRSSSWPSASGFVRIAGGEGTYHDSRKNWLR